jgi:Zn-dependent protease
MELALWIIIFLVTITIHEYAHGKVAYYFGDRTAYDAGRLTLNPLKHIDPFWTVVFPLMLMMLGKPPIGMAKPVPVNFMCLKNPKRDMIWVAAAGAIANIVFASILAALLRLLPYHELLMAIYLNLGLAVFNLIPIPPLDGSRVIAGLLPDAWAYRYGKLEKYGMVIVLVIFLVPFLRMVLVDVILLPAINILCIVLGVPPLT